MENKPRYLTICASPWNHPKVFIQGMWLGNYGFEVGAQVTLTNPSPGVCVIEQTKSRKQHQGDKRQILQERLTQLEKELGGFVPEKKEKEAELFSIRQELGKVA